MKKEIKAVYNREQVAREFRWKRYLMALPIEDFPIVRAHVTGRNREILEVIYAQRLHRNKTQKSA